MARYITRSYACPDNGCRFDYLHTVENGVEEPCPRYCPKCGADCEDDNEPIPMFGKVGRVQNQTRDKVYRGMEKASEERVQQAVDEFGGTAADYSGIKMTNMGDSTKEGDVSYIAPPSQTAAVMRGGVAPVSGNDVAALRKSAMGGVPMGLTGRPPSAGTMMLDKLRPGHNMQAARMSKAGEIARYSGK